MSWHKDTHDALWWYLTIIAHDKLESGLSSDESLIIKAYTNLHRCAIQSCADCCIADIDTIEIYSIRIFRMTIRLMMVAYRIEFTGNSYQRPMGIFVIFVSLRNNKASQLIR